MKYFQLFFSTFSRNENISTNQILPTISAAIQADHSHYISKNEQANNFSKTLVIAFQIIKAASTLLAMWAFHLQFSFLVQVNSFHNDENDKNFSVEMFALKAKRWTLTLAMFINGLEPLILNIILISVEKVQCVSPFNFDARWKVFENLLQLPQFMMLQWLAVSAYAKNQETLDHCCILHEDHVRPEECGTRQRVKGRMNNFMRRASKAYLDNQNNSQDESQRSRGFAPVGQANKAADDWTTKPTGPKDHHLMQEMINIRRMSRNLEAELEMANRNSKLNRFDSRRRSVFSTLGNKSTASKRSTARSKKSRNSSRTSLSSSTSSSGVSNQKSIDVAQMDHLDIENRVRAFSDAISQEIEEARKSFTNRSFVQ